MDEGATWRRRVPHPQVHPRRITMAHVEFRYVDEFVPQDVAVKIVLPGVSIGDVAEAFDSFLLACGFSRETINRMWEEGK